MSLDSNFLAQVQAYFSLLRHRPPNLDLVKFISSIENSIGNIGPKNSDMVLLGDFNVDFTPVKGKPNPAKKHLTDFARSMGL